MRLRRFPVRGHIPAHDLAGQALGRARQAVRERGQAGLCRLMGRASDARLEQIFAGSQAQRAAVGMMTRHFDPAKADGFDGAIVYDLGLADGTRRSWAIEAWRRTCPAPAATAPHAPTRPSTYIPQRSTVCGQYRRGDCDLGYGRDLPGRAK